MIHSESGQLKISETQVVSRFANFETIQSMNLGQTQELRDLKNGWMSYDVKNLKINNHYFNLSFLFFKQKMREVSFVFQEQAFNVETKNWSSWNENTEKEQAKYFNDWLDMILDGERNFEWGIVEAAYDSKSGFSSIKIRYNDIN